MAIQQTVAALALFGLVVVAPPATSVKATESRTTAGCSEAADHRGTLVLGHHTGCHKGPGDLGYPIRA